MKKTAFLQILFCFFLLTGLALFLTPAYGEEPENNTDPEEDKIYEPLFGEEQTSYRVCREMSDYMCTDSMVYIKDTLIDVYTYKIFKDLSDRGCWGDEIYYLRTNRENSKVYSHSSWNKNEVLVFDLTLKIGDIYTFPFEGGRYEYNYIVDSVYTDTKGRKTVSLIAEDRAPLKYLKFIEGSGSSYGFFPDLPSNYGLFLLCGEKDRQSSYYYYEDYYDEYLKTQDDPYYYAYMYYYFFDNPQCAFYFTDIQDTRKNNQFLLYPNPCREYITIESIDKTITESYHIQLSDLQGHIFLRQKIEQFPIQLQTSHLQSGNYIIRVFSNKKEIFSNLLLVQ